MKLNARFLSIRSRIILMLLMVSTFAAFVLIYISYQNGKEAITQGTFNQLKGIRASKQYQIETYFEQTERVVELPLAIYFQELHYSTKNLFQKEKSSK